MTDFAIPQTTTKPFAANVIGPYSAWPRRRSRRFVRATICAGGAGLIGVFVHCVVPLIA